MESTYPVSLCDYSIRAFKLTTVWWLTWITSSPAWIFLHWSAGDCRGRIRRQKMKMGANLGGKEVWIHCHTGMWDHKMRLMDCEASSWAKQELTFSVVPVITWRPSYVDLIYIPWNTCRYGQVGMIQCNTEYTGECMICIFCICVCSGIVGIVDLNSYWGHQTSLGWWLSKSLQNSFNAIC